VNTNIAEYAPKSIEGPTLSAAVDTLLRLTYDVVIYGGLFRYVFPRSVEPNLIPSWSNISSAFGEVVQRYSDEILGYAQKLPETSPRKVELLNAFQSQDFRGTMPLDILSLGKLAGIDTSALESALKNPPPSFDLLMLEEYEMYLSQIPLGNDISWDPSLSWYYGVPIPIPGSDAPDTESFRPDYNNMIYDMRELPGQEQSHQYQRSEADVWRERRSRVADEINGTHPESDPLEARRYWDLYHQKYREFLEANRGDPLLAHLDFHRYWLGLPESTDRIEVLEALAANEKSVLSADPEKVLLAYLRAQAESGNLDPLESINADNMPEVADLKTFFARLPYVRIVELARHYGLDIDYGLILTHPLEVISAIEKVSTETYTHEQTYFRGYMIAAMQIFRQLKQFVLELGLEVLHGKYGNMPTDVAEICERH
jgi:hypothetical protein